MQCGTLRRTRETSEVRTTRGSVQSSDRTARGFVSYYLVVNLMSEVDWVGAGQLVTERSERGE